MWLVAQIMADASCGPSKPIPIRYLWKRVFRSSFAQTDDLWFGFECFTSDGEKDTDEKVFYVFIGRGNRFNFLRLLHAELIWLREILYWETGTYMATLAAGRYVSVTVSRDDSTVDFVERQDGHRKQLSIHGIEYHEIQETLEDMINNVKYHMGPYPARH